MTMYARSREAALSIPLLVVLASACATGIAQQGVLGFDAAADVTPMKRASSATLTSSDLAIPNTMSTLSESAAQSVWQLMRARVCAIVSPKSAKNAGFVFGNG